MEKTLVIADTMTCEWCGNETDDLERNFAGDMCCIDCIDDSNKETAIIKTISDIDRLSYNEINKLLHELLPHLNITSATKICELLNQIVVDIRRQ
tara:strand:- start:1270 stop:1554 length:285 start_codon:yes stop_codon:yes gene_type:complete